MGETQGLFGTLAVFQEQSFSVLTAWVLALTQSQSRAGQHLPDERSGGVV